MSDISKINVGGTEYNLKDATARTEIQPIARGGTGATTAADARTNLAVVGTGGDTMTGKLKSTVAANDAFSVEHGTADIDAGFTATRTDTGVGLFMGVGGGGVNHGVWSNKLGKWMIYGDNNSVKVNGTAENVTGTVAVNHGGTGATSASAARTNLGAMASRPAAIEFDPGTSASHGGFLDFHYKGSTADYTSRIIEDANNQLTLSAGVVRIGTGKMAVWSNNGTYYYLYPSDPARCQLGTTSSIWFALYAKNVYNSSDRRLKRNISSDFSVLAKVFSKLRPVTFEYADADDRQIRIGFIAQEIETAMTEEGLNADDYGFLRKDEIAEDSEIAKLIGDTTVYSLNYSEFVALNTAMIQELQKENEELKHRLTVIEERLGIE